MVSKIPPAVGGVIVYDPVAYCRGLECSTAQADYVQLCPTFATTLSTTIGSLPHCRLFLVLLLRAGLQVEPFPTLTADEKPVTIFPLRIIVAIGDIGVGTQGIVTGHAKAVGISTIFIVTINGEVAGLDSGIIESRIDVTKIMIQDHTTGIGMNAAVTNDVRA